jgi:hypothetical protein
MQVADQLELGLPPPATCQGPARLRVWVLAGEQGETHRLDSLARREANFRHALVNAGTGSAAFRPDDLLLLRTAVGGQFDLLVPEQGGSSIQYAPILGHLLSRVQDALLTSGLRGQRSGDVTSILAVSFVAGGFDVRSRETSSLRSTGRRTGLEQVLSALADRSIRNDADRVVPICQMAEKSLNERVHPALRGLLRRQLADGLVRCLDRSSNRYDTSLLAYAAYKLAERDFEQCHFDGQREMTHTNYERLVGSEFQHWLPGFWAPETSVLPRNQGYCVRRLLGFPIELDCTPPVSMADGPVGSYMSAGKLQITDRRLLEILGNDDRERPRLVAQVKRSSRNLSVFVGLQAELDAMLGLPCRRPAGRQASLIRTWSDTIRFAPEELKIPAQGFATFTAVDIGKAPHSAHIRVESGPGQGEQLRILFH